MVALTKLVTQAHLVVTKLRPWTFAVDILPFLT